MITTSKIEREFLKKEGDLFFSSLRAVNEIDRDFIYAKEVSNYDAKEDVDSLQFCFFHDFGEHSSRYTVIFSSFIKSFSIPASIILIDFSGHGKSSGTRGHIDSLDDLCKDSITFLNLWSKGAVNILSLGLGGIVALKILHLFFSQMKFSISSLTLFNPGLKWRWKVPGLLENIVIGGGNSFKKVKLPFEIDGTLFAEDSSIAQEFDADPLINHSMTWGTFLEVQKSASVTRTSAYYLDIPVFIGLSGKGKLYESGVTELFARGISDCKLLHYDEAFHDLLHYHLENEKVLKDVYNWIVEKNLLKSPLQVEENE